MPKEDALVPMDDRFRASMYQQLGTEASELLEALDQPPETSVLLHPFRPPPTGHFAGRQVPWCHSGRILPERPDFTGDPLFHAGCYYVQESSSMFLAEVLSQCVNGHGPVSALDLCAAPGGKSVQFLSHLPAGSLLVANEVHPARWEVLQQNLDKWGLASVISTRMDPSRLPGDGRFDLVLVDAPCSGEGMFRKDPEARRHWSPDLVALCSGRQRRILHDAVRLLKPGGLLIYSTCALNSEENIHQVSWLAEQFGMSSIPVALSPDWGVIPVSGPASTKGYQFFPHRVPGEGFFCAALQKPGEEEVSRRTSSNRPAKPDRTWQEILDTWMAIDLHEDTWKMNETPKGYLRMLRSDVGFDFLDPGKVRFGTEIGQLKQKVFTPSHTLALSAHLKSSVPGLELDKEQALSYLRKEPIDLDTDGSGWYVVRHRGFALGWAKQTGSGLKNYFPTHLRIRR